ncbi:MAG: hypothetical protein JW753_03310 [Dehalococcoidia bacterium]|nr:hypothetical protein [Dehalococcoidia bacterium]
MTIGKLGFHEAKVLVRFTLTRTLPSSERVSRLSRDGIAAKVSVLI